MKLEHNLEPTELALALSASILAEGIEDEVIDTLRKSKKGGGEIPQEAEMRALLSRWKLHHRALLADLQTNIQTWIDQRRRTGPTGWWLFSSPETENNLVLEDILELEELIYDHYKFVAGLRDWPLSYTQNGFITPQSNFPAITREAYERGRGHRAPGPAAYTGILTGSYVLGVGSRISTRVLQRAILSLQSNYQGTVGYFINQSSGVIDPWESLAGLVRGIVTDADWKRDMDRIAATQLRWAYNTGQLQDYVEQGYDKVYYQVQPTACSNCRRILLHPDGKPRVFALRNVLKDIATSGGMNADRLEKDWKPTACIHPHCHCQIMPYVKE